MAEYCVNRNQQSNGDHEVHRRGCNYWPDPANVSPLGDHPSCHSAVRKAKEKHPAWHINGCFYCSQPCHTS